MAVRKARSGTAPSQPAAPVSPEHKLLVDAIESRDATGAHDIALRHFVEARDIRLALFADDAAAI